MTRQFHKMHGLGNDFVLFDARDAPLALAPDQVRALADRHRGIGCDQLVLLGPSEKADLRMTIFNADGTRAEACGNASRCVVALTGAATIETDGGIIAGRAAGDAVEVAMGEARFDWQQIPLADPMDTAALPLAWDELAHPAAINVGNPHLVFFVEAIDEQRLAALAPRIQSDPVFPQGINVNLVVVEADGSLTLRTFERGAGLTLACGTGACASAVAAIRRRLASSPVTVHTRGGTLSIAWAPGEPIRMTGPATHVFSGTIELGDAAG